MGIEYIARTIKRNIDMFRSETRKDISPEVGKILYNFVYAYKNSVSDDIFFDFLDVIKGLESYLTRKTRRKISLHDIRRSGAEICSILINKDKEKLSVLARYIYGLKGMDLKINGHDQIFP